MTLNELTQAVSPLDEAAMSAALERQAALTKPAGSLGRLEDLSILLAGITGMCPPRVPTRKAIVVFAGDHGVVAEGVSAFPQEVTPQMVLNFCHGGAAINVLARQAGARMVVVDAGVAADIPAAEGLIQAKIARGTADFCLGPAMTREQAVAALELGARVAQEQIAQGLDLLACGDMGIGNTTPSAAIAAVFTGSPVRAVTGYGTGIGEPALAHKIEVIEKAIALNQPDPADGLDVLAKVGGFEIGGIAGAMLAAAAAHVPVVVDGFIATAAALVACALAPDLRPALIAGHRSQEPGHDLALAHLGLTPLLDMRMRLGEGTGAVLAFSLVEAAAHILCEMATFSEAGISGKE
ncbi:MAG: nicotinate-nucleotide--dimethylbenzimidazole phosphoribosyltransferase [Anaerolineae bacterium]